MPSNCGAGEGPWTARRSNQSILKEINADYSLEGLMGSWSSNTLGTWCKELTHLKRPWCWERLRAGGEGDERMRWVWANSGSWWWTGRPGMLLFMGSQRVRHGWVTELNWTEEAAAAAKSLQSCLTLCDPIDRSPPGSPIPGILHLSLKITWFHFIS